MMNAGLGLEPSWGGSPKSLPFTAPRPRYFAQKGIGDFLFFDLPSTHLPRHPHKSVATQRELPPGLQVQIAAVQVEMIYRTLDPMGALNIKCPSIESSLAREVQAFQSFNLQMAVAIFLETAVFGAVFRENQKETAHFEGSPNFETNPNGRMCP